LDHKRARTPTKTKSTNGTKRPSVKFERRNENLQLPVPATASAILLFSSAAPAAGAETPEHNSKSENQYSKCQQRSSERAQRIPQQRGDGVSVKEGCDNRRAKHPEQQARHAIEKDQSEDRADDQSSYQWVKTGAFVAGK
jgi:hypothetical protein